MQDKLHGMANKIKLDETYKNMEGEEKELIDKAIEEIERLTRLTYGLKSKIANL